MADFGSFEDLEAAAKEEGALNVIALPHDWSNWGEVIETFKEKYPEIEVTELNPNASSKEEIDAAKTNAGTDAAPDVFDTGLAVASTNTDYFAPYKVQAWDKIPDELKDPDGLYYGDYTGIMSVGWNKDKYGEIESIDDLLDPKFAGTVALNGKPAEAGAAFNGFVMVNALKGGDLNNLQPRPGLLQGAQGRRQPDPGGRDQRHHRLRADRWWFLTGPTTRPPMRPAWRARAWTGST